MIARLCVSVLVCVWASLAAAQSTSVNLSGTVSDLQAHMFHLEVDHGTTPQAVVVTVSLTTASPSGLIVVLYDLDAFATLDYPFDEYGDVIGAGTVDVVLSLPAREGRHEVLVYIETEDFGPPSSYTGTASVDAGSIANVGFLSQAWEFTGRKTYFGRVTEFFVEHNGNGAVTVDFMLDFGETPHATTFAVQLSCDEVTQHRLLDLTSGTAVPVHTIAATADFIDDEYTYTTPVYSGTARFRLEVTKTGDPGWTYFLVAVGPDVRLSTPPASTSRKSKSSGTCAAAPAGAPLGLLALAAPALWATRRRRT
jgi:hypothetical protein